MKEEGSGAVELLCAHARTEETNFLNCEIRGLSQMTSVARGDKFRLKEGRLRGFGADQGEEGIQNPQKIDRHYLLTAL